MRQKCVENVAEMVSLGMQFGEGLVQGDVVALVGEVGAGKTHFCKGICKAFGYHSVSSPTYTMVNELVSQAVHVYHFDFYQIENFESLYQIGWTDYLLRNEIVLVEWADLYEQAMPINVKWIEIKHLPNGRQLTFA